MKIVIAPGPIYLIWRSTYLTVRRLSAYDVPATFLWNVWFVAFVVSIMAAGMVKNGRVPTKEDKELIVS